MREFTGFEYLLIDCANNHHSGLDKKTFDERLAWANSHLDALELEAEGRQWKERPLYLKACQAIRKAQQGLPTGHLVGFDAVCSGMQLMSVLTGCYAGAKATGLVDTNRRADAYTDCTGIMSRLLQKTLPNMRKSVKMAVMTSLYGSQAEPKKVFGDGTEELNAFYHAMYELCPGACDLLDVLLGSWRSDTLVHHWQLPDGFEARVKVMVERETKIEVDELNHATFTYVWYENATKDWDRKNAANLVHSVDAYVLRSLIRRCSYDRDLILRITDCISDELLERAMGLSSQLTNMDPSAEVKYYVDLYQSTDMIDATILPHLDREQVRYLDTEYLRALNGLLQTMLEHKPFPVVTVHDDFKCHPNNVNALRKHYRNILAELADSRVLDDLLSQLYGKQSIYTKRSTDLSKYIRQSEYALC
jgi:hypothetical protein